MAETLISPGVLARENDQSQITSQPIQAGAAIVGPTVLGRVNIPKLVTSYSEYLANYGSTFTSGSDTYTYFTSISAYNYFNNGGTSLLVTRVASGSWAPAVSSNIGAIEDESGALEVGRNISGSFTAGGVGGTADTYVGEATTVLPNNGSGLTLTVVKGVKSGKIADNQVMGGALTGGRNGATSVGTFDNVATSVLPAGGSGLTVEVITATGDAFFASTITTAGTNITDVTFPAQANINVADLVTGGASVANGGSGGVVQLTFSGASGAGVLTGVQLVSGGTGYTATSVLTITAASINSLTGYSGALGGSATATFTQPNLTTTITSVTAASAGSGYANGDVVTVALAGIGSPSADLSFPVQTSELIVEAEDATVIAAGSGYAINDVVTVANGLIGGGTDLSYTLVADDLVAQNVLTLETIAEGDIMNSVGPENANGALASGSAQNVRWEVQAPNTGSGVFSLIVRQGNDNSKSKSILEVFPNVSLDPKQSNYVARIVGDMTETLKDGTTAEPYLQSTGSYRNASRYVRVKSVDLKTPDYFDNSGIAKDQYTGSIPAAGSGSFSGATGNNIGGKAGIGYYEKITDSDTQGLDSTVDGGMGQTNTGYQTAFNLLANKDDYSFNILTAPGLYKAASMMSTPLTLALSNVQSRGDAILIMDLVAYNSSITNIIGGAAAVDNSYAATYWPWVQITDPDSAQLVWCPASALMPGVYAYNDKAAEAWFAPAGINRGGLSTVVQAERKLTQTNRDDLYTGKVNPIATFPGRGVVVFGQKTLQSQASALDRVNVRRLLIELKSYISQIADNLVFEQNTAATRNNFLAQVNPYLESVQQRQGLYAFKVVMDASNNGPDVVDRNQMVGAIYLQPTKTAEFIYLDFNILPTGASFPS